MSAENAMVKARTNLLMDHPFFGTLALKLRLRQDNDKVSTAATDGVSLLYNSDYIMKQSPQELRGLICHEVLHCTGCHHTRRGERDPKLWNIATDYIINQICKESSLIVPEGALLDDKYTSDWSPEAVYNDLVDRQDSGEDFSQCKWGMVTDADNGSLTSSSKATQEADWQVAVTQAAEQAKARGKLPGHLVNFISDIVEPKVNWLTVLWPFFTNLRKDDYTWRKPNRAYISEDEYLPSCHSEGCGKVAICFDTSGSTSRDQDQYVGELNAIISDVQPSEVVIVHCDYKVQQTFVLGEDEHLQEEHKNLMGQGGTQLYPAFEYLFDEHPDVEAVVFLTDLETDPEDFERAEQLTTCPVLWISTEKNREAPFGETVYLTD